MRRLPPLNSLRAFEAASRHMSFKKAAEELGVTPTAVSHQIRLLEEICGHRLFRRRPRPLLLTDAGQTLFPVLRDGFDRFAAAMDQLADADRRRPLVVTTTTAFAARWLLPRLADWYASHPEPPLEVRSSETVYDLKTGDVDFAVRYSRRAPSDATALMLFRDQFLPVLSPSLRARLVPLEGPEGLLEAPLIQFEWKNRDPDAPQWEEWFAVAGLPDVNTTESGNRDFIRVSDETQAIELALAGRGVAFVSDLLVQRELENGLLETPFGMAIPGYSFWVVYHATSERKQLIEAFVAWAKSLSPDRGLGTEAMGG